MKTTIAILALLAGLGVLSAYGSGQQSGSAESQMTSLLTRHYIEGEKLSYHMKATNKDRLKTMMYAAQADGVVRKDAAGHFYEEYQWSHVVWNGQAAPVAPNFRQILSWDPGSRPQVPDLQHAGSALEGPTLDLFTFYVDLIMALRHPGLNHAGDHVYVKFGRPSSWAAGEGLTLGEDSIDFDLTLQNVDRSANVAHYSSDTCLLRSRRSICQPPGCGPPSRTRPTIGWKSAGTGLESMSRRSARRRSTMSST